jgi:glycosyltransferase involved in cell wall biosynthesis
LEKRRIISIAVLKIFIDAHVFDDYSQGSKTYLKGLYSATLNNKPDWNFTFAAFDTNTLGSEFPNTVNRQIENFSSHNKIIRLGWEIPQMIKKTKSEFSHFQYISPLFKTSAEILTIHDLLFLDFPQYFPVDYRILKNFLFKRSAKRADLILTVSEYSRDAIIRHYNISADKIAITPNAVLETFFEEEDELPDIKTKYGVSQYILYVSRVEPRKNHIGLLRAYYDLGLWKKGIQLVLIGGTGIKTDSFTAFYQSLDKEVKDNVFFFQNLALDELKAFYKQSLLFVYPSFAEGFGIPPLEAIACGANVLCSGTTAMEEFRFLGDRLFDPNNATELKEKISYYLDHPPATQEINSTKNEIRKTYTWEASAKVLIDQVSKLSSQV